MIENFSKADFEKALPNDERGGPLWKEAGLCPRSNQMRYSVNPFPTQTAFAILVWSSLQVDGSSSKSAGEDSIRAVITYEGKPFGGKSRHHVPRTVNWRTMMLDMLRTLAKQIRFCMQPCPACGKPRKPFTCKQGENKGRQFVCCKNDGCGSKQAWQWCDTVLTEGVRNGPPPGPRPVAPEVVGDPPRPVASEVQAAPTCPTCKHHPMKRMTSGKGWRCGVPGNTWSNGEWTVCGGTVWDKATVKVAAVNLAALKDTLGKLTMEQEEELFAWWVDRRHA